ncbi:hypothetical protein [Bordetella genomosp. 11]|nr:hypothetical protein [Bordetella genomosp. 11]
MSWAERWERGDPAKVLERKQEMQARRPSKEAALARIERLFAGEDMAREMDFRTKIGPELHERLENWGWVMRDKITPGTSPTAKICHQLAVMAGKYKPEHHSEPPTRAQTADAAEIEQAWRNELMPMKAKMMLAGYYTYRLHPHRVCRAAAIRFADFDAEMGRACGFLATILERLAARRNRAQNPLHNLTADTPCVAE